MIVSGTQHDYVLWLMVMAYGLHIMEEFTFDWKSWSHDTLGFNLEWSNFYVTNAVVIVLGFSSAMISWKLPAVSLMFPAVAIINAIFLHIIPTIKARKYSPGLFTAIVGFLPIGTLCYVFELKDNGNNYIDIAISLIGGALLMAYPVVMIKIAERGKAARGRTRPRGGSMQGFEAKASIVIKADAERVWKALTEPAQIKRYLFGTQVECDWKVGSPITYRGSWEGKSYEDRGKIVELVPRTSLVSTYWSSMSGKPDLPENYNLVAYSLEKVADGILLSISQDNNDSEESAAHSKANWEMVLRGMKDLIEGDSQGADPRPA